MRHLASWRARSCALLAGLALGLAVLDAGAATPATGVAARLANPPVLRGQFEQEKHLAGFRNALLSKGDFLLARERGVVWTTRSPFASTLVLTKDRLQVSQGAAGNLRDVGAAPASPAMATTNALLMALLSGDTKALSRQFVVHETLAADGGWRMELLPKAGALKKIFARIDLQGDQYVRSVRLEEVRGDRTDIRFLQLRTTPATLGADEAKQLD